MHACNMQHSHVHMDARNTHAPMQHTAHEQHTRSRSSAQPTPYVRERLYI